MKMFKKMAINIIKGILFVLDKDHRIKNDITDDIKKFTHTIDIQFKSDHNKASKVFRTVPYQLWEVRTKNNTLIAADKHIVITKNNKEKYLQDLSYDDELITETGLEKVIYIKNLNIKTHTYDLELDGDHLYYSNGILSHNTTCAAAYLLWLAMFFPDKTILICANKMTQALEIMDRIKYSYEGLESSSWIRPGVVEYNKGNVSFDNGSSIIARATTKDSGRGLSISCLFLDEYAFVPPRISTEFWTAISPVLSTGGDCIITSTPNSDEDMFAKIWFGANQKEENPDEDHKEGVGANGFYPLEFTYASHPDRDEKWAISERKKLGDQKFLQEHACLDADTRLTFKHDDIIESMTIEEMYNILRNQDV